MQHVCRGLPGESVRAAPIKYELGKRGGPTPQQKGGKYENALFSPTCQQPGISCRTSPGSAPRGRGEPVLLSLQRVLPPEGGEGERLAGRCEVGVYRQDSRGLLLDSEAGAWWQLHPLSAPRPGHPVTRRCPIKDQLAWTYHFGSQVAYLGKSE